MTALTSTRSSAAMRLAGTRVLLLAALAFTLLTFAPRHAWAKYKFCATYTPSYTDTTAGEDYLKAVPHGLSFHRMILFRNGVQVGDKFADITGCYPDTQTAAGNYTMWVVTQVRAGTAEARVFQASNAGGIPAVINGWGNLPADTGAAVITKTYSANGTVYDGVFRASLAVQWGFSSFSVANTLYEVFAEATASSGSGDGEDCVACVVGAELFLGKDGADVWTNNSKATIIHEFGHLIANSSFGAFGTEGVAEKNRYCASVTNNAGFDACRCDQVDPTTASTFCGNEDWDRLHCLNSREYIHAAFSEGWGHYVATKVLNNTTQSAATFPYYKDSLNNNLNELQSPVAHNAQPATPYKWMDNKCSDSMTQRGTEMDWLSFFYVVGTQTANAYSLSNYWDVMFSSEVCAGGCTDDDKVKWADLAAGAGTVFSDQKLAHFVNNGNTYGVNH